MHIKVLILSIIAAAISCGQSPSMQKSDKITIAVSVHPIYAAVKEICGDKGDVIRAVDPGSDPHSFEPAPSTASKISRASLCVVIDDDFDGWMKKFSGGKTRILHLTDNNVSLDNKDHTVSNPHIWLYPPEMISYMTKVCTALSRISPENTKYFEARLAAFTDRMKKLDTEIKQILSGQKNRKVIQWHPAWDRFAAGYGIEISATVESGHGGHLSLKKIKDSTDIALKNGVRAVILNSRERSSAADSFVKQIKGTPALMDQIGGTGEMTSYNGLMISNARILAAALDTGGR